jgi:Tfp pilus assembly protein PilF
MGIALYDQGKFDDAVESYQKAATLEPDFADAHYNLGNAFKQTGELKKAVESYKTSLAINPIDAEVLYNYGKALKDKGEIDAAIDCYKQAIKIKPDYADAYYNMGNTLEDKGELDAAIDSYKQAIKIKPDYVDAYNNMGNALKDKGELNAAIVSYKQAIKIKPDYADAYNNLSFPHLLWGNLDEGFNFYEWRSRKKERTVAPARANFIWDGKQSLNGKHFVVYEEQGLGDVIQFCRYLPFLEKRGADVTFKVRPVLHALLRTMSSNASFSTSHLEEHKIDFETPLMSLPYLFSTNLETIPATNPYLYADHDRIKTWGERLSKDKFKIGICWQGSKEKVDFGRSFPLSLFEVISKIPNVELVSLHKGKGEDQIPDIDFDVTILGADFDAGQDAFIDTAAVMMNCDLVITSDTAVAHLAGALGCKTWVALQHVPDWRWMLDRADSPWYPTMTLYRQKNRGDWAFVFEAIKRDFRLLIDQKGQ